MKVDVQLQTIPDDNYGYARGTLAAMQRMVAAGAKDETVQAIAKRLEGNTLRETLDNDWLFLKKRIAYLPDPPDRERVTSARFTVGQGAPGDCDDMSTAAATVLLLQNIPCHFEAIEWRTNSFTHVICVVDLPNGGRVPFDLTMERLGDEHPPTEILEYPIMAQVETIADARGMRDTPALPTNVQVLVNQVAYGKTPAERAAALRALYIFYPDQVTKTFQYGHQARTFNTSRVTRATAPADAVRYFDRKNILPVKPTKPAGGLSDIGDLSGWITGIVNVVGDVISGNWSAIPLAIVGGLTEPSSSKDAPPQTPLVRTTDYIAKVTNVNPGTLRNPDDHPEFFKLQDPRREKRAISDYMTYLDELPQIFNTSFAPLGSMTIEHNYSAVWIPVRMPNIPVFGALQKLSPQLVFASFDNETAVVTDYTSIAGTAVGSYGWQLHGLRPDGGVDDFPGYYTRTLFEDAGGAGHTFPAGTVECTRFDFVGMNPADIPQGQNATPQGDFTKCTAYMWLNQGLPPNSRITGTGDISLPNATPPHVEVLPVDGDGKTITKEAAKQDPAAAAAVAYFAAGGGDAGYKAALAAYTNAGGTLADAAAVIAKLAAGAFAVQGKAPALPTPGGNNWVMDNLPLVGGVAAGGLLLILLLK